MDDDRDVGTRGYVLSSLQDFDQIFSGGPVRVVGEAWKFSSVGGCDCVLCSFVGFYGDEKSAVDGASWLRDRCDYATTQCKIIAIESATMGRR